MSPAAQIRRHFALLIADGRLQPGDRLPGLRAAAEHARVSINTVRAAYARLESEGLVATRQGLGTAVLPAAAGSTGALPAGDRVANTIGVVVAGLDPFYLPILQGIVEAADQQGVLVLVATAQDEPVRAAVAVRQLTARGVPGFIVLSAAVGSVPADAPPIVYLDMPGRTGYGIDLDAEQGGRLLGRHLADHGHRRVGLILPAVAEANLGGLRVGLGRGLPRGADLLVAEVAGFFPEHGQQGLAGLLALPAAPTAVVAAGAALAGGALEEAAARGLRVPGDLAVVGYADTDGARRVKPSLTMIGFPVKEAGAQAARMLFQLLAGRQVSPRRRLLAPELRVRASCGCEVSEERRSLPGGAGVPPTK